jgi:hypothetical protein
MTGMQYFPIQQQWRRLGPLYRSVDAVHGRGDLEDECALGTTRNKCIAGCRGGIQRAPRDDPFAAALGA